MKRLKVLIFFVFGLMLYACNNDDQAVDTQPRDPTTEDLKKAVAKYPDSLVLVQELVQHYRNEGQYDSAINLTTRELKRDPENAHFWNIKATLYYENGDTSKAIQALEEAINIYPLPEYVVALGTVYAQSKNKNALHIANDLLENGPEKNYDDAFFIKGLYYNYMDQPQRALPVLDSCLRLDYTYMYAYREKAIALYHLKKYNEALNVLKRAVTLQNNFDEGYYWMGRSYEMLHKKDSAIESYQNALLYDRNYIEAQQALDRLNKENKN